MLIESSSPRQIDELPGFRATYEEDKRQAKWELWKDRLRVCRPKKRIHEIEILRCTFRPTSS